ncbi:hypothetical protein [Brenneria alni]|nr:hypothetical protein [Brenneria alni]
MHLLLTSECRLAMQVQFDLACLQTWLMPDFCWRREVNEASIWF